MTRSFASISLVCFLLLQSAGSLVIFKLQQFYVRHEIKQKLKTGVPEDELVLLQIPKTLEEHPNESFQRIHSREFRYKGHMYDIVRSEVRGDTTWYYCIADVKETELFANLDEMIERDMNHNPERKKETQNLQRLINTLFLVDSRQPSWTLPEAAFELLPYQFQLNTWNPIPSSPPPEV